MKFKKKPVEIEAVRVSDLLKAAASNWKELPTWVRTSYEQGDIVFGSGRIFIHTSEGEVQAEIGDWVIRGVRGEIYPCKPDVFSMTYEEIQ